jgi:DNA-binding transcriptional ArsR family regulator
MAKSYRHSERIVRGYSNHRRIQMLHLLESESELDVKDLAQRCAISIKTASEHTRRLAIAGLVLKRSKGRRVLHALSPRGKRVLSFLKVLE